MLEEAYATPDQTAQPAPAAQTPQSTIGQGLQGTVDQQSLGDSGKSIDVQSSSQQAQALSEPAHEQIAPAGLDMSTGLLIAIFTFALLMILLLAWLAIRNEKNAKATTVPDGTEENEENVAAVSASVTTSATPRRTKKPTKRQRRQQQR